MRTINQVKRNREKSKSQRVVLHYPKPQNATLVYPIGQVTEISSFWFRNFAQTITHSASRTNKMASKFYSLKTERVVEKPFFLSSSQFKKHHNSNQVSLKKKRTTAITELNDTHIARAPRLVFFNWRQPSAAGIANLFASCPTHSIQSTLLPVFAKRKRKKKKNVFSDFFSFSFSSLFLSFFLSFFPIQPN